MRTLRSLFWSAIMLALLSAGCQTDSRYEVSGPEVAPDNMNENPVATVVLIDSSGGQVQGVNGTFIVPAGALSTTVPISMSYASTSPDEATMGPAGQQFSVGCDLILDKPSGYQPTQVFTIFWWDPSIPDWVDIGGTSIGPSVKVEIDHFSRYKIEEK